MTFLDIACEDIWMANNKLEAEYFVRLFEEELTFYHWRLLEEVLFGQGEAYAA
jgi:hypothetical protein